MCQLHRILLQPSIYLRIELFTTIRCLGGADSRGKWSDTHADEQMVMHRNGNHAADINVSDVLLSNVFSKPTHL